MRRMQRSATEKHAHSLAEIRLFFLVTPCPACGKAGLRLQGDLHAPDENSPEYHVFAACSACFRPYPQVFVLPPPVAPHAPPEGHGLNPSGLPSELIDLPGWITLHRLLMESAWNEPDKREARRLSIEAGQCLDEALRFYPPNENMPLRTAFFTEAAAERFRRDKEQFDRRLVLHHRSKLPRPTAAERTALADRGERPWWKFWQRQGRPRVPG